jgi:hypothetical protein
VLLSGLARKFLTIMNMNCNETKTPPKKDKNYWKEYNAKRKEYLTQKKRESRDKLKSSVSNQVVDIGPDQPIVNPVAYNPEKTEPKVVDKRGETLTETVKPTYCCAHLGYNLLGEEWHTGSCPK